MTLQFTSAQTKNLPDILTLQQENLVQNRSLENIQKEGFVTVVHSLHNLKKICGPYTHSVALDENNKVVGFALVMLKEYRNEIEVLKPLFNLVDTLIFDNNPLQEARYFVMGQVCVAKAARKQGVFSKLYAHLIERTKTDFDYIITEISSKNQLSLKAHAAVGFKLVHQHKTDLGEEWNVVILPL